MAKQLLGIIAPLYDEMSILKDYMLVEETRCIGNKTFYIGTIEGKKVILALCGVGKVNAAMTTQILIDYFDVTMIINIGTAGTLDPDLDVGDIVIASQVVQNDIDQSALGYPIGELEGMNIRFFPISYSLNCLLLKSSYQVCSVKTKTGMMTSSDQFSSDEIFTEKIIENFGYVQAVEMEAGAIAQVAFHNHIPFTAVRGISNRVDETAGEDYASSAKKVPRYYSKLLLIFIKCYY